MRLPRLLELWLLQGKKLRDKRSGVRSSDSLSCRQGIGLILYDAREGSTKASSSGVSSIQKEIQNLIKMGAG